MCYRCYKAASVCGTTLNIRHFWGSVKLFCRGNAENSKACLSPLPTNKAGLQTQTRQVCKRKQGWFANTIKTGLHTQTRLVCKHKQGWFANPNKAGLQTQSRQVCTPKQGWFTNANKAGLHTQTRQVCKPKQGWFTNANLITAAFCVIVRK